MTDKLPGAAYDNKITVKFATNTVEKKAENKADFCGQAGLSCGKKDFLVAVVIELSDKNEANMLEPVLEGMLEIGVCVAVRAIGSKKYQDLLSKMHERYAGRLVIVADEEIAVRQMLAAADASFFFNSGQDNDYFAMAALRYAALPIAPASMKHIVENYNANQETGNGFLFEDGNMWSGFAAVVRALENFSFPYDWKNIQKIALEN